MTQQDKNALDRWLTTEPEQEDESKLKEYAKMMRRAAVQGLDSDDIPFEREVKPRRPLAGIITSKK